MSARQDMAKLLGQWLELTKAEGGAIESAAWARVGEIQAGKAELQKTIVETHQQWMAESPQDFANPASHPFRAEVGRLISLESRNGELLAAQLRRARVRQEMIDQANVNIRKIRGSYVRRPAHNVLQCYS